MWTKVCVILVWLGVCVPDGEIMMLYFADIDFVEHSRHSAWTADQHVPESDACHDMLRVFLVIIVVYYAARQHKSEPLLVLQYP